VRVNAYVDLMRVRACFATRRFSYGCMHQLLTPPSHSRQMHQPANPPTHQPTNPPTH
jgi:hypothetical protein